MRLCDSWKPSDVPRAPAVCARRRGRRRTRRCRGRTRASRRRSSACCPRGASSSAGCRPCPSARRRGARSRRAARSPSVKPKSARILPSTCFCASIGNSPDRNESSTASARSATSAMSGTSPALSSSNTARTSAVFMPRLVDVEQVVVVLVGGLEAVHVLPAQLDHLLEIRLEHRPVRLLACLLPDRLGDRGGARHLRGELGRNADELVVVAADDADEAGLQGVVALLFGPRPSLVEELPRTRAP